VASFYTFTHFGCMAVIIMYIPTRWLFFKNMLKWFTILGFVHRLGTDSQIFVNSYI